MTESGKFISINLHLTEQCNMSCRTCFARYSRKPELGEKDWLKCLEIIDQETADIPKRKINFVGGEPTLLPYLSTLIKEAKHCGFVTGIVTNGHKINDAFLNQNSGSLDILGISVDSLDKSNNALLGRCCNGICWGEKEYFDLSRQIQCAGYCLKINTVVSALNLDNDFTNFIYEVAPDRWKVFQCLIIEGQNERVKPLLINDTDFKNFIDRHSSCKSLVVETTECMKGSYIMIDPLGRPYGNSKGHVAYGKTILEAGLIHQLKTLGYSENKAILRGADYFWSAMEDRCDDDA